MRYLVVVLMALLAVLDLPATGMAAEVVLGRVTAVEAETGQVRLQILAGNRPVTSNGKAAPEDVPLVLVLPASGQEGADTLRSLEVGQTVRVWGEFIEGDNHTLFQVQHILPAGRWGIGRPSDPTGVRARLGRAGAGKAWPRGRGARKGGRR